MIEYADSTAAGAFVVDGAPVLFLSWPEYLAWKNADEGARTAFRKEVRAALERLIRVASDTVSAQ